MPFEFLQTNFSNQAYAKFKKKTTHLFTLCRSLILNLMYLCNFGSSSSEIVICSSPLCPLSNSTSLIQVGFSKEELCTISQDDLIIEQFSRANLYDVPRVTVSTFGSEKFIQETTLCHFSVLLTKFQSDPQRESYDDFPQVTCLECNSGVYKKTNFLRSYLRKYRAKSSEIRTQGLV